MVGGEGGRAGAGTGGGGGGGGDGSLFGEKEYKDSGAYLAQQHGHDGESQQDGAPHIK